MIAYSQNLLDKKASVEIPGVKVVVDKNDNWETVGMILVLILGVYAGIKIINKIFKEKNEKT